MDLVIVVVPGVAAALAWVRWSRRSPYPRWRRRAADRAGDVVDRWLAGRLRAELRPAGPPVEALAADLARLAAELRRLGESDAPAKHARLRATALAYDLVLLDACRALEVPAPADAAPIPPHARLEVEVALTRAGLHW